MAEGIPPVSTRLIEKIRRWEFIDLAQLIGGADSSEGSSSMVEGHIVTQAKSPRKSPSTITDLATWLQAYARLMVVLLSAPTTSKAEAAGLAAHLHIILQLAQDLGGRHWLVYDWEFREWAAAKGITVWGELNLSIYGRCLPRPTPQPRPDHQIYLLAPPPSASNGTLATVSAHAADICTPAQSAGDLTQELPAP